MRFDPQQLSEVKELIRRLDEEFYAEGGIYDHLKKGDLVYPMEQLRNVKGILKESATALFGIHSGLTFAASLDVLVDELSMGRIPSESTIKNFRAYLAQTKLPLDDNLNPFTSFTY